MHSSSTSDKIQRNFNKKMRLNEEKAQLVKNIREKYKALIDRNKRATELTNKLFEPIVTPLKTLTKDKEKIADPIKLKTESIKRDIEKDNEEDDNDTDEDLQESEKKTSPLKGDLEDKFQNSINTIIGHRTKHPVYGFNVEIDKNTKTANITTKIEKYPVIFDYDDKVIRVNSKEYPLTKNLANLLLTAKVSNLNPTPAEVDTYNQILHDVGDFPTSPPTESEKSKFYRFIRQPGKGRVMIKKLSKKLKKVGTTAGSSHQYGGRGPNAKNLNLKVFSRKNQDVKYIYWDSPSELIHRLCLLISTKQAGNTSPQVDEEIASIEEELREANIIE